MSFKNRKISLQRKAQLEAAREQWAAPILALLEAGGASSLELEGPGAKLRHPTIALFLVQVIHFLTSDF